MYLSFTRIPILTISSPTREKPANPEKFPLSIRWTPQSVHIGDLLNYKINSFNWSEGRVIRMDQNSVTLQDISIHSNEQGIKTIERVK